MASTFAPTSTATFNTTLDYSDYFAAVAKLEKFLLCADEAGDNVLTQIDLATTDTDHAESKWAELIVLTNIDLGMVVYIKVFGEKEGCYAIRRSDNHVVEALTLEQLKGRCREEIPIVGKAVESIMNSAGLLTS